MAKAQKSLEEGLNRSANKRGLTGKERHRYIGGALHNMGKAKTRDGKREPVKHTASAPAAHKPAPTPAAPTKKAYSPPKLTARPHIHLVGKRNVEASKKHGYNLYSIYHKDGRLYSDSLYRTLDKAKAQANLERTAHNDPRGLHHLTPLNTAERREIPEAPPKPRKKPRSHKNDPKQGNLF